MADVVTKVGVEGSQQYKAKMAELVSAGKALDSEMKALTSSFSKNTTEEEKARAKINLLGRTIFNQEQIVNMLGQKYEQMTEKLGELEEQAALAAESEEMNAEAVKKAELAYTKYQTSVNKAAAELNNATAVLNNLQNAQNEYIDAISSEQKVVETTEHAVEDLSEAFQESGKEAEKASGKMSVFGDTLKANLSASAIKGVASGVFNFAKDIVKGTADLVLSSAAYADEIITLSSTTGLATDTLQELRYMAELTDVSLETLTGAQTRLVKAMGSAASGGKAAAAIFKKLGVEFQNGEDGLRDFETVFGEALEALGGIENETERDAAAMELFGKSARDLNPLIEASAESLEALRKEAHDVGYVLNTEQLSTLGKVDDAYQRWQKRVDTLKTQLGVSLAPAADTAFDALEKIAENIDWEKVTGFVERNADAFAAWVNNVDFDAAAEKIKNAATSMQSFADSANNAFETVSKLANVFSWLGELEGLVFPSTQRKKLDDLFQQAATDYANAFGPDLADQLRENSEEAEEAIVLPIDEATDYLSGLGDESFRWGEDMMRNFKLGLRSQRAEIASEFQGIAQDAKDYLGHSTPKKGPMSNDDTWMPDMMMSFAQTMEANQWRVAEAAEKAAAAMAAPILQNRQQAQAGAQVGHDNAEILEAIRGVGGTFQTTVVLEGDARGLFRAVRSENNRVVSATGYNPMARR